MQKYLHRTNITINFAPLKRKNRQLNAQVAEW